MNSERDIEAVLKMINEDNYDRRKKYLEHVFESFRQRTKKINGVENLDLKKLQSEFQIS